VVTCPWAELFYPSVRVPQETVRIGDRQHGPIAARGAGRLAPGRHRPLYVPVHRERSCKFVRRPVRSRAQQCTHGLLDPAHVVTELRIHEQRASLSALVLDFDHRGGVGDDGLQQQKEVMTRLGGFLRDGVLLMLLE